MGDLGARICLSSLGEVPQEVLFQNASFQVTVILAGECSNFFRIIAKLTIIKSQKTGKNIHKTF